MNRRLFPRSSTLSAVLSLALLAVGCGSTDTTPSAPTPTFTFGFVNDSRASGGAAAKSNGVSTVVMNAIAKDMVAQNVALVVFPGDMVTGEVNDSALLGTMFDTWQGALAVKPLYDAKIPIYTTRGNHEYNPLTFGAANPADPSLATYKTHFPLIAGTTSATGAEAGLTYSFTYKNAKFVAFDQYANRTASFNNTLYAAGSNKGQMMGSWALAEVRNSTAGVTFVMSHEQLWPSTSHSDCMANDPDSRDALVTAMGAVNGTFLTGHDHMLLTGTVKNGTAKVPMIIAGTGGGGNYDYAACPAATCGAYSGPATFSLLKAISLSTNPTFGWVLVTVYSDNTWKAQFRSFQFNKWNDATDVSLTPITASYSFQSSDF